MTHPQHFRLVRLTAWLIAIFAASMVFGEPAAKVPVNTSLAYLDRLVDDCAKKKPGAFESAEAIARRLIEHDGLPAEIPEDIESRAIAVMLDVFLLKPERNQISRYLAQAPPAIANAVAEKAGKERLAQLLLIRVDGQLDAATDLAPLFEMTPAEVSKAARSTLWPLAMPVQRGLLLEQASTFEGAIAKNVLTIQPMNNNIQYLGVVRERLYCFETPQEEGRMVLAINKGIASVTKAPRDRRFRRDEMRRRDGWLTSLWCDAPSPVSGLAVVRMGNLGNAGFDTQRMPEWIRPFIPEKFDAGVQFVAAGQAPEVVTPATQPAYVKPAPAPPAAEEAPQ